MLEDGSNWHLHEGDCIEHMHTAMEANSVDFSVFSPPFPAVYAYTDSVRDIGNIDALNQESKIHLSFMFTGLRKVLKPGRCAVVHCNQIPRMKRNGEEGLCDFRGTLIRLGERAGLIYDYDWCVRRNPQAQAIRTRSRELQFSGLENDRSKQRGTLLDYLIKFRKPGVNEKKIDAERQVSRNEWIDWAEGCWSDIVETDTLNVKYSKGESDTRHICPLPLEISRRCILLFSDPGEIVFSPFAGIGSEGFVALGGKSPKTKKRISDPRKFYGCELKKEYAAVARKNLAEADRCESEAEAAMLF